MRFISVEHPADLWLDSKRQLNSAVSQFENHLIYVDLVHVRYDLQTVIALDRDEKRHRD
ncbi:MAG: hypothetical protein O9253_01885 [Aquidulcibacter sp.]|nr:hypothetical protein [Aquidulcibacter sp.]